MWHPDPVGIRSSLGCSERCFGAHHKPDRAAALPACLWLGADACLLRLRHKQLEMGSFPPALCTPFDGELASEGLMEPSTALNSSSTQRAESRAVLGATSGDLCCGEQAPHSTGRAGGGCFEAAPALISILPLSPSGEQCGGCRRSNTTDRPHSFQVILTDRPSLELSADNEEDMADWMQYFCQAVSKGVSRGQAPSVGASTPSIAQSRSGAQLCQCGAAQGYLAGMEEAVFSLLRRVFPMKYPMETHLLHTRFKPPFSHPMQVIPQGVAPTPCVPCCLVLTDEKAFTCHEDCQTSFFRSLGTMELTDITAVSTEAGKEYCILVSVVLWEWLSQGWARTPVVTPGFYLGVQEFAQDSKQFLPPWVLYFSCTTELERFLSALNAAWRNIYQVSG